MGTGAILRGAARHPIVSFVRAGRRRIGCGDGTTGVDIAETDCAGLRNLRTKFAMEEVVMRYDFNVLEDAATRLAVAGHPHEAIKIYLFMADGDPSLDSGYLAERLGVCYEQAGEPHAAKYWYGRALEESAGVRSEAARGRERLEDINIDYLLND
jgi:hypothetical protein